MKFTTPLSYKIIESCFVARRGTLKLTATNYFMCNVPFLSLSSLPFFQHSSKNAKTKNLRSHQGSIHLSTTIFQTNSKHHSIHPPSFLLYTLIGRASPRILRYQARLRASPFLQSAQAAPRRPVDRVFGIDAAARAPRLLLVGPDRSSVRRLVHADTPPRRSLVSRYNGASRALVQAFGGDGSSRASLGAAIDQLHVRHAPPRASRTVGYQRVSGASTRAEVPVLGHERRPRPGQRDQAVPGAPVVAHVRHQRVSRAQRGRVGQQRVPRAVKHVRREVGVRDQTVSRAPRHPAVPG